MICNCLSITLYHCLAASFPASSVRLIVPCRRWQLYFVTFRPILRNCRVLVIALQCYQFFELTKQHIVIQNGNKAKRMLRVLSNKTLEKTEA